MIVFLPERVRSDMMCSGMGLLPGLLLFSTLGSLCATGLSRCYKASPPLLLPALLLLQPVCLPLQSQGLPPLLMLLAAPVAEQVTPRAASRRDDEFTFTPVVMMYPPLRESRQKQRLWNTTYHCTAPSSIVCLFVGVCGYAVQPCPLCVIDL